MTNSSYNLSFYLQVCTISLRNCNFDLFGSNNAQYVPYMYIHTVYYDLKFLWS